MISVGVLTTLVYIGVGMTIVTPIILIALLIRDWKRGNLW